jgi:sortase B
MENLRRTLRTVILLAILGILAYWGYQIMLDAHAEYTVNTARESYKKAISATLTPLPYDKENSAGIAGAVDLDFIQRLRQLYGNEDIVGYLNIGGTNIDYLVTQHADNEFYLTRDIYKRESIAGWVFMDCTNNAAGTDKNIVLYAHNMRNRIMFHDLRLFKDEAFYRSNRLVEFNTARGQEKWEIYSFYETDDSVPYNKTSFSSNEEFMVFAERAREMSWYDTNVEILAEDRILTLSTCSETRESTRIVAHAFRMTP